MSKEEVNWLLQTIPDPENAKRFLLAQYQRGRISAQLMNDVAPEPDGINSATLLRLDRTRGDGVSTCQCLVSADE